VVDSPYDTVKVSVNRFSLTDVDGGIRTILSTADEHATVASKRASRGEDVQAHVEAPFVLARMVSAPPDAGTLLSRAVTLTVGFTAAEAAAVVSAKPSTTRIPAIANAAGTRFISSRDYVADASGSATLP
jgi:hypothetical protein